MTLKPFTGRHVQRRKALASSGAERDYKQLCLSVREIRCQQSKSKRKIQAETFARQFKRAPRACVTDRQVIKVSIRESATPVGSRVLPSFPLPNLVETYERPKRRYILRKHAGRDVWAFQRGLLHPPPACRTALPDDRQGVAGFAEPSCSEGQPVHGSDHLGQRSQIEEERKQTTKTITSWWKWY